jgi:hypothetical protein
VPRSVTGIAPMIASRVWSSARASMVAIARISVINTTALALLRRIDLLVQVVDHAVDDVDVRRQFHVLTLSRAIPAIRPQLIPVW